MTRGEMREALNEAGNRIASLESGAATNWEGDICEAMKHMWLVLAELQRRLDDNEADHWDRR